MTEPRAFDHVGRRAVPSLLAERIAAAPDRVALVFEDACGVVVELTYADFGGQVARVAAGLVGLGVGPGDRVALCLPSRPEFVLTFFALARIGAVGVPCNPASSAREMSHVIGLTESRVLVATAGLGGLVEELRDADLGLEHVVSAGEDAAADLPFADLLAEQPLEVEEEPDPKAPLEIIFTSGTTAAPKGVVLTHANWLWAGERASHWHRLEDRDRLLTALPLFHVNAQSFTLLAALTVGATAIFLETYSASRFIDQVRGRRATQTNLVATQLRTLLAQPERADDAEHELRRVGYSINVSDAEKEGFERRFGVELLNGYGLTEAMTEVTVAPVYGERRWPSVGRPALGREVRIDREGAEAAAGEIGEILVKGVPGRTIMHGYYRDPEATAATIVDGWLHTGDKGYFDADGFLYFFDRAKDVIKRGGENISATEVEATLTGHPAIALAAVIGIPDPIRDEAVMAFVVAEPGAELDEEEVRRYCAEQLARFKVPTVIRLVDSLPMTSIGKVEKKALREMVATPRRAAAEDRVAAASRELEEMVGRAGPELRGTVSARDVARFAVAAGEDSPVYTSVEAARAAGYEDLPSPPLLLTSVLEWGAGPPLTEPRGDGNGGGRDGWLPLAGLRLLGGDQSLELHRPVPAGTELVAQPVLVAVELEQGGSGETVLLTIETGYRTLDGEPLITCREKLTAK
jgi:crotonobetaine/carnitine-CoA ligase